jgi:hypothetical protein
VRSSLKMELIYQMTGLTREYEGFNPNALGV